MTDSATVRRAVVHRLNAAGVGEWVDNVPAVGELPLLREGSMPGAPDRVIAVTCYDEVTDEPSHARAEEDHAVWMVQVRVRDREADVDATAEAARRALEAHHVVWDGVRVTRALRRSFGPMGVLDGLAERSDNYEVTAGRS